MRRKLLALGLAVLLLTLVACGGSQVETRGGTLPGESSRMPETAEPQAQVLTFLQKGELYVDIQLPEELVKNFRIQVDDKAISEDRIVPLTEKSSIKVEGEGKKGEMVYVYFVREKVESSEGQETYRSTHVFSSIDAEALIGMLGKRIKTNMGDRTYVAILAQKDAWNHNLSPQLNQLISEKILPFVR